MGISSSHNNKRKKINKDRNQSENEKINNIRINNENIVKFFFFLIYSPYG